MKSHVEPLGNGYCMKSDKFWYTDKCILYFLCFFFFFSVLLYACHIRTYVYYAVCIYMYRKK